MVPNLDVTDSRADGYDIPDELMSDHRAALHAAKMASDDMEVGSADPRQCHPHQGVCGVDERRLRRVAQGNLPRAVEDDRFHGLVAVIWSPR